MNWLQILLSVAGPIIAGLLTIWFGFRQIERTHQSQVIAQNRQAWINRLRERVAELCGLMRTGQDALRSKQSVSIEVFQKYYQLKAEIRLMLNPDEGDSHRLIESIQTCEDPIHSAPLDDQPIKKMMDEIVRNCGVILKTEWQRVKAGV